MANFTDEDLDAVRQVFALCTGGHGSPGRAMARYREHIEARVRAECDDVRTQLMKDNVMWSQRSARKESIVAERDKRIAALEAKARDHADTVSTYVASADAARKRIADLTEQLESIAEAIGLTTHEREVTQQSVVDVARELVAHDEMNANACRDKGKRIAELEQQLAATEAARDRAHDKIIEMAAAKPVLTAEDESLLREYRSLLRVPGTITARMIDLLGRLCPPPKAPPTDAELVALLHRALFDAGDQQHGFERSPKRRAK